jgi:hypothetical protein
MRLYTGGITAPPLVYFITRPELSDTDGDGMDDYAELYTYPFLDPNDPSDYDYDHDGLSNHVEIALGTTINNWDTDGDTLPDGIEVEWGVTSPVVWDWLGSDADGDGLVLSNEYHHGSNLGLSDTDGDGVDDATEVSQGSNPTNPSDGGATPPQSDTIQLTLSVGDHSQSDSEIYKMTVSGERTIRFNSGEPGNEKTGTFTFKKGETYTITIAHAGTSDEQMEDHGEPDYDYTATVSGSGIIIEDAEGILGVHGTGSATTPPFDAEGKTAKVHTPKITLAISKTTMTLKHDNQSMLTMQTSPAGLGVIIGWLHFYRLRKIRQRKFPVIKLCMYFSTLNINSPFFRSQCKGFVIVRKRGSKISLFL